MTDYFQYWARILGAIMLIKVASSLVKDAEKLITANVKARNPEIAEELDATEVTDTPVGLGATEWADPLDRPPELTDPLYQPVEMDAEQRAAYNKAFVETEDAPEN